MPAVVDLPYCIQCGAAPEARHQLNCAFCGAVLPWELWDELSRERVEITPVDEASIEAAIERAERFATSRRPRSARRLRRLRDLRRQRRDKRRVQEAEGEEQAVGLAIGAGLFLLFGMGSLIAKHPLIGLLVLTAIGGGVWLVVRSIRARRRGQDARARRSTRRNGRVQLPASVLTVGQPELTPGTETHWRRVVTLYVRRGHQRVLHADADVEVRAGDTGVASVLGNELIDFHAHENVADGVS